MCNDTLGYSVDMPQPPSMRVVRDDSVQVVEMDRYQRGWPSYGEGHHMGGRREMTR